MSTLAVGWDVHRKFSQVSLQQREADGEIRVVKRARFEHADRDCMRAWLRELPARTPVALEAAFGWPWIADLLDELQLDPHLGHPPAIRVLAKNEAKADRVDADRLGRFWLRGIFPESYLAPPEVRQLRERLRYRMGLAKLRSSVKHRVQAALHRYGILHDFSDLFGKRGRAFLNELTLPASARVVIDGHLELLDLLCGLVTDLETWLEANLWEDDVARWLQTVPGIGLILSHVIRAEIGQLTERFASAKKLASYAGLAPMADDSADRRGRRHISAACNHALRWAFIEAAGCALRSKKCPAKWHRLHDRLTCHNRVNKNPAKVAVAREMCELVYVLWKKGEPYREPHSSRTPPRVSRASRASNILVRSEESR